MHALDRTTKLRAAFIRNRLLARHAEGTALRERLNRMSDEDLVALDNEETAAKIAHLQQRHPR